MTFRVIGGRLKSAVSNSGFRSASVHSGLALLALAAGVHEAANAHTVADLKLGDLISDCGNYHQG